MKNDSITYPYIPNSVPEVKNQMLDSVGVSNVDELYIDVPRSLWLKGGMNLPKPFLSEAALRRHVEGILCKNKHTGKYLNFLGAGCYQHYVPAVCDEVNQRGEFLTAYAGEPYDDHGRFQALFEYCSMMGALLEMDVVSVPTYDGFQATATALRMACRITGRKRVLIPEIIGGDKLSRIRDYLKPEIGITLIKHDPDTGGMNIELLRNYLSEDVAAVYFENPTYLGLLEMNSGMIAGLAHEKNALVIVSADPISLGAFAPPIQYGADLVCGDIQSLGMHMQFGGGHGGFIASRDEEKIVMQYPSRLFGITPTRVPGEYGFGDVAYERTSFAKREAGNEWVGTASALWGITAGVYLALMGPQGMKEIGEGILYRTRYAMQMIDEIPGVKAGIFHAPCFREFVVDFRATGRKVSEINAALLSLGIFGGKDLSMEFPWLKECALYCITEIHTKNDIDRLVSALKEVLA